jgi:hypothetical protein
MELNKVIGYDFRKGEYVVGTHDLKGKENKVEASTAASGARYSAAEVDELLATMAIGTASSRENHSMLGAQIVEPIMQVVPYVEMWSPVFFQDMTYDYLEDNTIPVEDLPVIAYETHQEGAVLYTKAGYSWTRPDFDQWDVGIEVPWATLKKAGWNFLARQMNYATWALARKRDANAKNVLTAAIPTANQYTVSGGKLTKTAIDAVLKAKASIGFPVRRVLINSGTIMDMAQFTWPTGLYLPDQEARELIRNLYLGEYGGADFYINPFAPTDFVYFGGLPNQIGWHQVRGAITAASDVDITNKVDKHAISDAEHAWYVGNVYTLASLQITA